MITVLIWVALNQSGDNAKRVKWSTSKNRFNIGHSLKLFLIVPYFCWLYHKWNNIVKSRIVSKTKK